MSCSTIMAIEKQQAQGQGAELTPQGYEDERFETKFVDEFLHCLICLNVLREPVMCRNEHYYCRGCITKHIHKNCQTCPTCSEELTVESLSEIPRAVKNILNELIVRCDHYSRGCREPIQLQNLNKHVNKCGYKLVHCGNEGCTETVNQRDRIYHENELCEFRRSKCHNCENINIAIDGVGRKIEDIETNMLAIGTRTANMEAEIGNMATELTNTNAKVGNLGTETAEAEMRARNANGTLENMEKITTDTHAKLTDVKRNLGNLETKMKNTDTKTADMAKDLAEMKEKVQNMETSTENINKNLAEIGAKIAIIKNERSNTNTNITLILLFFIVQFVFLLFFNHGLIHYST